MVDSNGQPYAKVTEQMENSYAGTLGKAVAPAIAPLGFDWRTGVALIAGFAAKEIVVSTMGTLYSMAETDALVEGDAEQARTFAEMTRTKSGYTPLTAYVLMLFTLIYVPCMATVAIMKRETNGWKWPAFTVAYTLSLAWIVSFVVYQGGMLLGIGV